MYSQQYVLLCNTAKKREEVAYGYIFDMNNFQNNMSWV